MCDGSTSVVDILLDSEAVDEASSFEPTRREGREALPGHPTLTCRLDSIGMYCERHVRWLSVAVLDRFGL